MEIRTMLEAARIELANPRAQQPSRRHLLHLSVGVIQSFLNRMTNTGRAWTVGETTLAVSSGSGDYSLGVNIGKVLDVVTYEPDNQSGTEEAVAFGDLSNITGNSGIAFYRKGGNDTLWAKVRPIPTESRTYYITYSIGSWAHDASLDDSPLLEQHHPLLVCKLARAALPAARWSEDAKADSFQRNDLRDGLDLRIGEYERDFKQYIASVNIPRMTQRAEAFAIE